MKKILNKAIMILLVVIMALSSVPVTNIYDLDFSSPFAITAEAAKATIKFQKSKPSVYTGEKYTLKLLDKKGKTISASKIKWKTADKKIATVDKKGVVKGIKAGKVKITATYKKKKYIATVTVKESIKFKKSKINVYIGEKYTLKLVDKNGKTISNDKIKWSSADKEKATVNKKGVVKGIKAGKVKITATYKKKKYVATVTIKESIKFKKSKVNVYIGEKYTLKLVDKNGKTISNDKIKWSSADKKIATVNKKGVVKGVKAGKVKIAATYKNRTYTSTVTVKNMFSVNKSKLNFSLEDRDSKSIKVTYKGEEDIYYQVVEGKDIVTVKWDDGWDGDVTKLYIKPISKDIGGKVKIKIYDEKDNNNCIYIDVNVEKEIRYGSVTGTVTYKYNDYRGHVADVGADVILIPTDGRAIDLTMESDGDYIYWGYGSELWEEKYGIYVTEVDGMGDYYFDMIPEGNYVVMIISKETTSGSAFDDRDAYINGIASYFSNCLSESAALALGEWVGYQKYAVDTVDINSSYQSRVSKDFGITYI